MAGETLREQLRADIAESAALRLRLNAVECVQLAAGLADMGPKFDGLRVRCTQWADAMLGGERAIRKLLAADADGGDE